MPSLLFATNNQHKLREIQEIMGRQFRILSLKDVNLDIEIPEDQATIEGNAVQKARFIHERTGLNCFADDTGFEIDALEGRPGVYSARYAGEGCSFDNNIDKILQELSGIQNRKACFRCVICLIMEGKEHLFEGRIDGVIIPERRGKDGFGYDPVFLPDGHTQTFAEMPAYLKNGISHRGRAAEKMRKAIKKWAGGQVD
jgi:XTP/dITP diphosphohydrolase